MKTEYDVVVTGAGPAGSVCANLLAQHGLSVAVVEQAAFPRFRIGESLLPCGNPILRRAGVYDRLRAAGFPLKHGAEFISANGEHWVHNRFDQGLLPADCPAFEVDRRSFDSILLEAARERGVTVFQPARVAEASFTASGVNISLADGTRLQSRYIVDAGGRNSLMARQLKIPRRTLDFSSKVAVYSHFRGVPRLSEDRSGNILIIRLNQGWCWFIPLRDGITSVGCVQETSKLRGQKGDAVQWFQLAIAETSVGQKLLAGAEAVEPYEVVSDYSYRLQRFGGERALLIGDAAAFLDPIFSSGVYLGLQSAADAADLIFARAKLGQAFSRADITRFTRNLDRRLDVMQNLIQVFYSDRGHQVFMAPTDRLQLYPAINSIVAGHTRLPWSLRWRFRLFLLLTRLNERYNFIQPNAPEFLLPSCDVQG